MSIFRIKIFQNRGHLFTVLRHCSISTLKPKRFLKSWKDPPGYKTNVMIYNSSIKRKTQLITQEKKIISWYCCGPTVYDSAHIGHACCYIRFDIIRRILEKYFSHDVIFIMGITDIDDKIIKRANEDNVPFRTISQYYENEFFKDMKRLNVRKPTITARVSDYIEDIICFVQRIIDNGFGYVTSDGSVHFPVGKYDGYGILHNVQEDQDNNNNNTEKHSSRDFAMWKGAKENEPSWPSPWGMGRPGWHIECSTIASKLLGKRLDLHSGGIDLKFPHHENEEAQCCVYHNENTWVTYWLHSGHVYLTNSTKMSKSLQNTISIDNFLSKYTSDDLRMLCLMIPYRNGIEYGEELMENAVTVHNKFKNFINDCKSYISGSRPLGNFDESALIKDLTETKESVLSCLADDFDTSAALSQIVQFITRANIAFTQKNNNIASKSYLAVSAACSYLENFLSNCGFTSSEKAPTIDSNHNNYTNILNASIQLRTKVRDMALSIDKKNTELHNIRKTLLTTCDEFRNNLNTSGVELKDHGKTTSWNFLDSTKK